MELTKEEKEQLKVESQAAILENWLLGKKRRSRHSNAVFATRKDRIIFDSQFLKPRERVRAHEGARRAKSIRG